MADCGKVNMVQVDNTTEECDGQYMDYKCIIVTDSFDYIGTRKNIKVSELIQEVDELFKEQRKTISWLKREVKRLNDKIKKLKDNE